MVTVRRNLSIGAFGKQLIAVDGRKPGTRFTGLSTQQQFTIFGSHNLRFGAATNPVSRHPLQLALVQSDRRQRRYRHAGLPWSETRRQQSIEQTLAEAVPCGRRTVEHCSETHLRLRAVRENATESEAATAVVQQPYRCA
ncbi:TPA: hypothetical protein ACG455_004503, partial [Stenotrophomonas maltophilia]